MSWAKTLELLEFARILQRVAEFSLSAEAADMIRAETPSNDQAFVSGQKNLAAAIRELLKENGETEHELPSVGFLLPKLTTPGASLDLDEAFALGLFMERGEAFRRHLGKSAFEQLAGLAAEAPSCRESAAEIFSVINRDGGMKDLPQIKKIRLRIAALSRELENTAARYTSDEQTRRMLQSPLPSQRNGRLVLALKAQYRGRIQGIIHEASSSGQTVFVEPQESVETNNLLLLEKNRLDAEIRNILRELSAKLAARGEEIALFHKSIIYLETLRAKAAYALDTKGTFALDGGLDIKNGRHPLLGGAAVPVCFTLDDDIRAVIITGPNTGGKTVTLKTIGLFALMNQTGLALPAAEGTALPVFDGVFADIGDEQSISQSLSTFSSHMVHIAEICANAGERSLALLDELGSGTDPEEGGAIAMALLDHFIEKNTTLIATTHHGVLKNYGYGRKGVQNASVEFDPRTLSPTYRIVMGLPGESRALDIAARNGIPAHLIARAREYIDEERSSLSALIAGLREKHQELDAASQKAEEESCLLRERRRNIDLKELSLRQKEYQMKAEGAGAFRSLLAGSRKQLENLVRELREGEIDREKTLRVKEFIKKLEHHSADMDAALEEEEALLKSFIEDGETPSGIRPGLEVAVLWHGRPAKGTIVRKDNRDEKRWIVELGAVKMTIPETGLRPFPPGR